MMRRVAGAAALMVSLVACTTGDEARISHVDISGFRDTSALTVFIADILANSLDAPKSTLRLAPFEGPDPARAEILLTDTLRERGFGIAPDGMAYPGAHEVRFSVTPVGPNIMLALDVDDASATCLYNHTSNGATQRIGQCTIRNGLHLALAIPPQTVSGPIAKPAPIVATSLAPINTLAVPAAAQTTSQPLATYTSSGPVQINPGAPATEANVPIIAARPSKPSWTLVGGQPIRDQMQAWADRAGWTVVWPERLNWLVPATASFTGDYTTVLSEIVTDIVKDGRSVRVHFYDPNHTVVVTMPGGEQLPQ